MVPLRNGIVRPQQIKGLEHHIGSTHIYQPAPDANGVQAEHETINIFSIDIKCVDSRLTDLLTRLISGVLYSNNATLQTAEENVLREMGKWPEEKEEVAPDITKEATLPPVPVGQGDGN